MMTRTRRFDSWKSRSQSACETSPRRRIRVTLVLLVCVGLGFWASEPWAERIRYGDAAGESMRERQGRVTAFEDGNYTFEVESGGTLRVPGSRVIGLEFDGGDAWARGRQAFAEGRWNDAFPDLVTAYREEKRDWARFEIQAILIRCAYATKRYELACRGFQELIDADPQSRHDSCIPLPWVSGVAESSWQATASGWLKSESAWDRLLGAAWLLSSSEREQAIKVLQALTKERDKRIVYLATTQLWRETMATADRSQVETWRATLESGPVEFRSGPRWLIATATARLDGTSASVLDALQMVFDEVPLEALQAEGLFLAARGLNDEHPDEAQRLLDELQRRFPESDAAALGKGLKR